MRRVIPFTVALLLFFVSSLTNAAQTLRWKFKPGQTFTQTLKQRLETSAKGGPFPLQSTSDQENTVDWRVESVDRASGTARLQQTVRRIKLKVSNGRRDYSYDSAAPEQKLGLLRARVEPMLKAMLNATARSQMTARGETMKLDLPAKLVGQLQNSVGGEAVASQQSVTRMLQSSLVFPEKPLAPGDHWTHDTSAKHAGLGLLKRSTRYEYAGRETAKGATRDRILATIQLSLEPEEQQGGGLEFRPAKCSGVLLFDSERGFLASSEMQLDYTVVRRFPRATIEQRVKQVISSTMQPK